MKPEKDFSKEADKQIPEAEKLAKVCPALQSIAVAAIDHLLTVLSP